MEGTARGGKMRIWEGNKGGTVGGGILHRRKGFPLKGRKEDMGTWEGGIPKVVGTKGKLHCNLRKELFNITTFLSIHLSNVAFYLSDVAV